MKIDFQQPSFISWPISPAMKFLFLSEEKWSQCFSLGAEGVALLLNTMFKQLREVDYFISLADTQQFFKFLSKLIESKPQESQVLKEINNIVSDLFKKIILKKRFNEAEAKVPIYYLSLLKHMLEFDYRYLFEKPEINIHAKNFLSISSIPFHSSALLTQFRHTLRLSFQCKEFIKDHIILLRAISNLAKYIKKIGVESNELAAMQLLDILGALSYALKASPELNLSRVAVEELIQRKSRLIYRKFRPFVEDPLLKYSVYKFFLTQAYKDSENLPQVCESSHYYRQCSSKYIRFKDSYRCAADQLPYSLIDIQNNNRPTMELNYLCTVMRASESFVSWMEELLELKSNGTASQYFLHLADCKKDFLADKFLFEYEDSLQESRALAIYFPSKSNQTDLLLGSTYTYATKPSVIIHEYIHHLSRLFFNSLALDLTLTKGMAELYSEGICSRKYLRDLDIYVNEAIIFDLFNPRQFLFYFSALEWVAYLVNEKPRLFKTLMSSLRNEGSKSYYAKIDAYINNASNRQALVAWVHQQADLCSDYLNLFPDTHQPPLLYLQDIKNFLNQTQTIELRLFNSTILAHKRALLAHSDKNLNETALVPSKTDQGFSQRVERGLPLSLGALFAGFSSSYLDDLGLAYSGQYPYLRACINYGFKPFLFALMSASLNTLLFDQTVEVGGKLAQLYTYFAINFLSVLVGQPLAKVLAERIQNKILCFFLPMLTWTLLWNPSLFLSEESQLLPTLFLQLTQGLCFKLGEETYRWGKSLSSSGFWHTKSPITSTEDNALNDEGVEVPTNTMVSVTLSRI